MFAINYFLYSVVCLILNIELKDEGQLKDEGHALIYKNKYL